jgi:hypothetical protein
MIKEKALEGSSIGAPKNRGTKVLYVSGWGRSGSTILGSILGQVEGFFSVGELRLIWDRGIIRNWLCGCGVPFRECPVWSEVVSQAFGDVSRAEAQRMIDMRERGPRTRHLLVPTLNPLRARVDRAGEYPRALEKLYRAVRVISQSRVIVDTSKLPSYGYVLQNTPGIELYTLHLVRDPRAVAYSWGYRRKPRADRKDESNNLMTRQGIVRSSLAWDARNLATEGALGREPERYMPLRYEDFVEDPRGSVEDILRFVGEEEAVSPFASEREVALEASHSFSGNPNRFKGGAVEIEPDKEWKSSLNVVRQAAVATLTWPGLVRYGYPLWPRRGEPASAPREKTEAG